MVAKTGRRTQSWASVCMGYRDLYRRAVEQLALVAGGHGLVAGESGDDADLVALDVAGDDHAQVRGAVVDGEDLVGIGGLVADRRRCAARRRRSRRRAAGRARWRTCRAAVPPWDCRTRFQDEDARVGVHRRIDGGDLAGEIAIRDRRRRAPPRSCRLCRGAACCSGVCSCSFMVPMRTMVAILLVSATYSPAATGRAVMKPSKGARMVVSASAFSACASCARTPSSEACEVLHGAAALARGVERGFVLLAGGVGLRVGGLLLRCAPFRRRCARRRRRPPGSRSAWHRRRPGGPGLGRFVGGAGGGHLRQRGSDRTFAWPLKPMRDCDWRTRGGGLIERGARLVEAELGIAMIELADHLALLDEIADVDRRGDDAAGHQRRDVAGFIGDEGAGLLEGGRNGAGDGLRGGDGDGLRRQRDRRPRPRVCRHSRPEGEMRWEVRG